ncbi:MAG: hypothetical protein ABL864_14050 [Terricaulis sp.]
MVAPTQNGDVVLNEIVLLRDPSGPTTSGYAAWIPEAFNPFPPVEMATNDKSIVYAEGLRPSPGGDMAQARRYTFEVRADWAAGGGLDALLVDLNDAAAPTFGTALLTFMLDGTTWTATGRYDPISMVDTSQMHTANTCSFEVRFRATAPRITSDGLVDFL